MFDPSTFYQRRERRKERGWIGQNKEGGRRGGSFFDLKKKKNMLTVGPAVAYVS